MNRPKTAEDDYFRQQEAERREEEAWDRDHEKKRDEAVEREQAGTQPVRRCPSCRSVLEMASLRQVEIERCKACNGVWLDYAKLERLTQPASLLSRIFRGFRR